MKIHLFIEKYFWVFLLVGILLGLWIPVSTQIMISWSKVLLVFMLFFVFLKTDALEILENIKDYKMMIYIVLSYMIIVPLLFYFLIKFFDPELAAGILLLTAMPAGLSSPALTDIAKGNVSLSVSLVILTQIVAPFTVPLLFGFIEFNGVSINRLSLFKDMVLIVFVPMIISQIIKRYLSNSIIKVQHLFTSFNIFLIFLLVYFAIASQRHVILDNPVSIFWKTAFLYFVFILLHAIGYLICYKEKKENRVALSISSAYMNNGMAIVLAAAYFGPAILVLMVLSEIPWNTLLAPFKRVIRYF